MSRSIAWQIPTAIIEMAMKMQNNMSGKVKVWSAGFDESNSSVIVIMDIEEEDWETLRFDPDYENGQTDFLPLDDGTLPIQ